MSEAFAADYFDEQYYLRTNPDVLLAITSGHFNSAYEHFQQFGQFEMRAPNVMFDAASYLLNNPDVLAAVSQGLIPSAWYHFVNFGVKEGAAAAPSRASSAKRPIWPPTLMSPPPSRTGTSPAATRTTCCSAPMKAAPPSTPMAAP
ncbi:hypothetical protein [Teichococcus aestuarii]|uniref:hypothetical protein n=1 Tax=Teichococcus aestuarii TaxID=568898 RepID=UPI0036185F37